ncbi:MAG: hypothetical protein MJ078_02890, partial [Clostridia bacterium]|nr:hypothetical protein [Clostridia bacterium]
RVNEKEQKKKKKDKAWLAHTLEKNKIKEEDVFLLTLNDAGEVSVTSKEKGAGSSGKDRF